MRDDDELRELCHFSKQVVEPRSVGLIEWRIDLVQKVNGLGFTWKSAKMSAIAVMAISPPDKSARILEAVYREVDFDVHTRLEHVFFIGQYKLRSTAAHQLRVAVLEENVHSVKGLPESLAAGPIEPRDGCSESSGQTPQGRRAGPQACRASS